MISYITSNFSHLFKYQTDNVYNVTSEIKVLRDKMLAEIGIEDQIEGRLMSKARNFDLEKSKAKLAEFLSSEPYTKFIAQCSKSVKVHELEDNFDPESLLEGTLYKKTFFDKDNKPNRFFVHFEDSEAIEQIDLNLILIEEHFKSLRKEELSYLDQELRIRDEAKMVFEKMTVVSKAELQREVAAFNERWKGKVTLTTFSDKVEGGRIKQTVWFEDTQDYLTDSYTTTIFSAEEKRKRQLVTAAVASIAIASLIFGGMAIKNIWQQKAL